MIIVRSLADCQAFRDRLVNETLGFVPTMGALHSGHASLIQQSVSECDKTVLSIYVNAAQFNNAQDLANYPNTLTADLSLAETLGVDIVLIPTYEQMYPDNFRYQVAETDLSLTLCGAHRPGHFTGVLTVVMKLFNLVKPDKAYFGQKDFQQFRLVRDMVKAFFLNVEVVACKTLREDDGLAMSSRNINLTAAERLLAPTFYQKLASNLSDLAVAEALTLAGFKVDYIQTHAGRRYGAVSLGRVRLIDNILLAKDAN